MKKSIPWVAVLALVALLVIAASLPKYVGTFYGDGTGLTNVSVKAPNLLKWSGSLETTQTNIVSVAVIGDSIASGAYAEPPIGTSRNHGWQGLLRTALQLKYGNAGYGWIGPWSPSGCNFVGAGWQVPTNGEYLGPFAQGKRGSSSGSTTIFDINAPQTWTYFDLVYAVNPYSDTGIAPIQVQVGYSVTITNYYFTVTNSATEKLIARRYSTPGTNDGIRVWCPTNGWFYPVGVVLYLGTNGILVHDFARSGALVSNFCGNASVIQSRSNVTIMASLLQPKLTIFSMSVNDAVFHTSISDYSNMVLAATQPFSTYGSLVLIGDNQRDPTAYTPVPPQFAYHDALRFIGTNNSWPMLDIQMRWGSYSRATAMGFMYDGVHPGANGHYEYAAAISSVLNEFPITSELLSGARLSVGLGGLLIVDTNGNATMSTMTATNGLFVIAPTNGIASPPAVVQPIGLFGSMMLSGTTNTVTIGSSGTYYTLTNYGTVRTNGFGANKATGFLTNTVAGYYRITVYASMIGGSSDTMEGEVFLNETGREEISLFGSYDAPARVRTMSSTGILYIPANTGISFRLNNRSDTDNISVWRAAITVGTP